MSNQFETATLAGGCFWCLEAVYDEAKGVLSVESGYSNGHVANPSYRDVCNGNTGHAEVIQIKFDPDIISFRDLLNVFFTIHDPTTLNRQGADVGTQYRSAIFYHGFLHRRGLSSGIFCAQSEPAILSGCGRAESGEIPQALSGAVEETACINQVILGADILSALFYL